MRLEPVSLDGLDPEDAFRAYLAELHPTEDLERSPIENRIPLQRPLRAILDEEGRSLGRVTRLSPGSLWVETRPSLAPGTPVHVDWVLFGGHRSTFSGTVVGRTATGLGIRLDVDEASRPFRTSFVAIARGDEVERRPEVQVRRRAPEPESRRLLWTEWKSAERELGDDEGQQRFIAACLEAGQLDFALERYRAIKAAHPGRPEPTRYLEQIGTLLRFAGFRAPDTAPRPRLGGMAMAGVVGGLVLLAGFAALAWFGRAEAVARQAADPPASVR